MTTKTGPVRLRYRLITLWDIMRPFRAVTFLNVLELLNLFQTHERAVHVNDRLNKFLQKSGELPVENEHDFGDVRSTGLHCFTEMEPECIALELVASLATVRKLMTLLALPTSQFSDLYPLANELRGRLIDEMESKCFVALNTREREYYEQPRNGWEQIITRFPDSVIDIEEASKSFALSRYTAAVFHSLQVVEVGLVELGKLIGVSDPLPGWTATTNALQKIIKKGHEARTTFERQNFAFFEQIQGTIEGLKNAWRNKVSHVHGKLTLLTSEFSPEIAEEILFATRAFMRRLATDSPVV
jgi:hypothetical protein